MAEYGLHVAYDGPALREGRMEVRELAPALLALADLFREANHVLHPDESSVSLEIEATRDGSFDIGLVLVFFAGATSVLSSDPTTGIVNLKELVVGPYGLLSLVKRLRGRRVVETQMQPEAVVYTTEDGDRLTIPRFTHAAFQRVRIRRSTREFLQPLEAPGIDKVVVRETDSDYSIEIGAEEQPRSESIATTPQPIHELDVQMALEITSPNFKEGNSGGSAMVPGPSQRQWMMKGSVSGSLTGKKYSALATSCCATCTWSSTPDRRVFGRTIR